jgi:hypothetical protein
LRRVLPSVAACALTNFYCRFACAEYVVVNVNFQFTGCVLRLNLDSCLRRNDTMQHTKPINLLRETLLLQSFHCSLFNRNVCIRIQENCHKCKSFLGAVLCISIFRYRKICVIRNKKTPIEILRVLFVYDKQVTYSWWVSFL